MCVDRSRESCAAVLDVRCDDESDPEWLDGRGVPVARRERREVCALVSRCVRLSERQCLFAANCQPHSIMIQLMSGECIVWDSGHWLLLAFAAHVLSHHASQALTTSGGVRRLGSPRLRLHMTH